MNEYKDQQPTNSRQEEKGSLKEFQEEIRELARKEKKYYEINGTGSNHFENVNPEDLTDEDMAVWQTYKEGNLTKNIMDNYALAVTKESGGVANSRTEFRAMMFNKILIWNENGTSYGTYDEAFPQLKDIK